MLWEYVYVVRVLKSEAEMRPLTKPVKAGSWQEARALR